jgi:hypothetical protein
MSSQAGPGEALVTLAAELRDEGSVVSPHVIDPDEAPALGLLAAAGPRTAAAPAEYALVVETIREGYLLHYGPPRLLSGHDSDLALLAGDYLYALGLRRLAELDDQEAVLELSNLISLCAQAHAEGEGERPGAESLSDALWLAAVGRVAGFGDGLARAAEAIGLRYSDWP